MIALLWLHIAAGCFAVVAGAVAVAVRKGGPLHVRAGTWFLASMLVLGITAAILEPFRTPPGSPLVPVFVCYLVLTSWVTARRRDGSTGRFEIAAGAVALTLAAGSAWDGLNGTAADGGPGPLFVGAALCLVAGLLDLSAAARRKLRPAQRIARHLWRMCFAFFIATFSFFVGQQDLMPAAVRGSPALLVLGFAPLAVMTFWLVQVRLAKRFRTPFGPAAQTRPPATAETPEPVAAAL